MGVPPRHPRPIVPSSQVPPSPHETLRRRANRDREKLEPQKRRSQLNVSRLETVEAKGPLASWQASATKPTGSSADRCPLSPHKRRKSRHFLTAATCHKRPAANPPQASSASDLNPRCSRSHTPTRETDWVGKSRRGPTPSHSIDRTTNSCSCR